MHVAIYSSKFDQVTPLVTFNLRDGRFEWFDSRWNGLKPNLAECYGIVYRAPYETLPRDSSRTIKDHSAPVRVSGDELAEIIGNTKPRHIVRGNRTVRKLSASDIEKVRALRAGGVSWKDIGVSFGMGADTIRIAMARHG